MRLRFGITLTDFGEHVYLRQNDHSQFDTLHNIDFNVFVLRGINGQVVCILL